MATDKDFSIQYEQLISKELLLSYCLTLLETTSNAKDCLTATATSIFSAPWPPTQGYNEKPWNCEPLLPVEDHLEKIRSLNRLLQQQQIIASNTTKSPSPQSSLLPWANKSSEQLHEEHYGTPKVSQLALSPGEAMFSPWNTPWVNMGLFLYSLPTIQQSSILTPELNDSPNGTGLK